MGSSPAVNMVGSQANKRVNLPLDPVTALAQNARAAPVSPASYAQR